MGASLDLARRTAELELGAIPAPVIAIAKTTLLDTLAVAIAARRERVVEAVHDLVSSESPGGPCTLWGSLRAASPAHAALANATAAHALDFDDVCWAMNGHPSAVLWPVAIAVAESVSASGEAALLGYIAGFEAEAALGAVLGREHYALGWHPTATLGVVGAAMAAGKILGLDEEALLRALGIACSEASGSRANFGTDVKPLHAGFAARAGVTAALLAARGVTARKDAVEAPMGLAALYGGAPLEAVAPERGDRFALVDPGVELKPYPSCRFTHRVIDATLALRARSSGRELRTLACSVDPFSEKIVIYPRPTTGLEAKFSMQYCAAIAWLDGSPGPSSFTDDRVAAPDVASSIANIVVENGSAEVETVRAVYAGGDADTEAVRFAKGHPQNPLTRDECTAKLRRCALPVLAQHQVDALAESADSIERAASIRELTCWCRGSD
jgi:2-methylcitrate dehydratase PrpD